MEERVERNMVQKYSNKKNSQPEIMTMKKTKEYKNRNIERKTSNKNREKTKWITYLKKKNVKKN